MQVIPARVIALKVPKARHPVGRIHVRTNGGEEMVEVSLHRSTEKRPIPRFIPSSIRISWSVMGIIEERLVVKNTGKGTLRGTIPSSTLITVIPSIFGNRQHGLSGGYKTVRDCPDLFVSHNERRTIYRSVSACSYQYSKTPIQLLAKGNQDEVLTSMGRSRRSYRLAKPGRRRDLVC